MKHNENPGYIAWLQSHGVERILTTLRDAPSKRNNTTTLIFKDKHTLCNFTSETEINTLSFLPCNYAVISDKMREQLKQRYLIESSLQKTLEKIDEQLKLIKIAKSKIMDLNLLSDEELNLKSKAREETRCFFNAYDKIAYDKVGMLAKMLRNKSQGWGTIQSLIASDIAHRIYQALNYDFLSSEEHRKLSEINQFFSRGKYNLLAQTAVDVMGIITSEHADSLIKELVEDLLEGGYRKAITDLQSINLDTTTLRSQQRAIDSYYQKRFFPDKNGNSETDRIIIAAGGLWNHIAYRILQKEIDLNIPGGFRYYYTKVDGGGGIEIENSSLSTIPYGVYTTEITPKVEIKDNPEQYTQYMRDTLQKLLEAEKQIEAYKPKIFDEKNEKWELLNKIIIETRGTKVEDRSYLTGKQKSGNCSVYSPLLLVGALCSVSFCYEMMKEISRYSHHDSLCKLFKLEEQLLQEKAKLSTKGLPSSSNTQNDTQRTIMQAALNGHKINNQDPIEYAIEQQINLYNMHPLVWAVVYNKNSIEDDKKVIVSGKPPIVWALQNPNKSKVNGMSFAKYIQVYELDRKKSLKKAKIDLLSSLVVEYDILKKQVSKNIYSMKNDIKELEEYYSRLTYTMVNRKYNVEYDRNSNISPGNHELDKYLKQISVKQLADLISTSSCRFLFMSSAHKKYWYIKLQKLNADTIMQNLSLPAVHKLVEVAKELQNRKRETSGYISTIREAIYTFIEAIKLFFGYKILAPTLSNLEYSFAFSLKSFVKDMIVDNETVIHSEDDIVKENRAILETFSNGLRGR